MIIQDVVCHIPPPGFVFDYISGEMMEVGIYSASTDPVFQKWEIPPAPDEYDDKRAEEEEKQESNPDYTDPELELYRTKEWFRRINGFWFMNNGKPVYITGNHYYYLAHWKIDIGPPSFWYSDLQFFYFWASCVEDPRCGGMLGFDRRRAGKSWKSSSILTESLTRTKRALGGIQSKSGSDAKDFFQLFVVEGFKQLPHFFKPEYDRTQGDTPKAELRFFATSEKGRHVRGKKKVGALNSRINFKDASERAYDGKKLRVGVMDEFGKLEDADLEERHRVLKFCIQDGPKIVGKLLYITTVEDIKNSECLRKAQKLFKESDPLKRNGNGQTESLLYRFRLPFYESYMMDDYGMPLRDEAKQRMQATIDELTAKGDYVSVASERRKNPWNDDDIFRSSAVAPIFDVIKISEQISHLSWKEPKDLYRRGNFAWEGGVKNSRVKFVDVPNGRFLLRTNEMENARQSLQRPINKHRFASGVDPFDHKASFEPSNGAAHVLKKYDPTSPSMQNEFILEYCARPQPNVFFQDMVKMCIYFGMPILCESNKIGLINYFTDNGYGEFLTWLPGQKNPGIFAGEKSKQHGAERMDNYVTEMCHTIEFMALLDDLSKFDLSDSTKYDRAMSAIWTLVAAGEISAEDDVKREEDINDFFKKHRV